MTDSARRPLAGRRLLVVGASSGIGRSVAIAATRAGAQVAVAARRADRLTDTVAAAGAATVPIVADVTDEGDCRRMVDVAVDGLDGLDTLVYASGMSVLGGLTDTPAAVWQQLLATNVIGAARVVAAACPALARAAAPTVALLSSSSVPRPWPGLVPYAVSKAGLDELGLGLRIEEPWLRVIRVVVGPTISEFADGWDPDQMGAFMARWAADGYLTHQLQPTDDAAATIVDALVDAAGPDDIVVMGEEEP